MTAPQSQSLQPEFVLHWVPPGAVSEQDLAWLKQADEAGPAYQSIPDLDILRLQAKGELHLFRLSRGEGVLLVEVRRSLAGLKRLCIVRAGGRNMGWIFPQLAALLQHTAREWGCQQIETMVYDGRLAKAMRLVGAKAEAINMVLEV